MAAAKKQQGLSTRTMLGFAAAFALVFVSSAVGVAGFALGLTNSKGKASSARVTAVEKKVNPTRADVVKAACAYAVAEGLAQGVQITKCGLAKGKGAYQVKGDAAQVIVEAEASQPVEGAPKGIRFALAVQLSRGIWQGTQVALAAEPEAIK